jgi:hypothetical protein
MYVFKHMYLCPAGCIFHTYIHTWMHAYIYTGIITGVHSRIHTDIHACIHTGMMTGKAGYIHFHLGEGFGRLRLLNRILDETEIPARVLNPTHVNRK